MGINGSYFYPFKEKTPWNYYPYQGDPVHSLGESIANGKRYGKAASKWNVVCFTNPNRASIPLNQKCPDNTTQGIAGKQIVVKDGLSTVAEDTKPYPRTAVGVNKSGDRLWLIVIDGKQPFYSEGATLKELSQLAITLGCDRLLNLDGGGSTTIAIKQTEDVKVLNAPIHTRIPLRERPVANHLGFAVLDEEADR